MIELALNLMDFDIYIFYAGVQIDGFYGEKTQCVVTIVENWEGADGLTNN